MDIKIKIKSSNYENIKYPDNSKKYFVTTLILKIKKHYPDPLFCFQYYAKFSDTSIIN